MQKKLRLKTSFQLPLHSFARHKDMPCQFKASFDEKLSAFEVLVTTNLRRTGWSTAFVTFFAVAAKGVDCWGSSPRLHDLDDDCYLSLSLCPYAVETLDD